MKRPKRKAQRQGDARKSILLRIVILLCMVAPLATLAQGCPPGQYLVAGQGWHYCADVPGAQSQEPENQTPRVRWMSKWLSLTVDTTKGVVSTGISTTSQHSAEEVSMGDCTSQGGTDCRPEVTVMNGCVALAVGEKKMASQSGTSKEDAESKALRACSALDNTCKPYLSRCALPEKISD